MGLTVSHKCEWLISSAINTLRYIAKHKEYRQMFINNELFIGTAVSSDTDYFGKAYTRLCLIFVKDKTLSMKITTNKRPKKDKQEEKVPDLELLGYMGDEKLNLDNACKA